MKKEIITEPTQIIQFAEDIRSFLNANEYLKEDALFLDVGSPLRVSFHYWGNWGFAFDPTKQDCLLLYDAAQDAYSTEWMPTGNELNNLVAQAAINAGLGDVNKLMNKKVAEIAVDLIKDIPFGNIINIADIGTGTGAVVLEIVNLLGNDDNRLIFHLVEPSEKRLEQAEKELRSKGVQRIETYNCRDVEYNSDQADIVVSTAAIHHNSFLRQALRNVYEHMHPGAFFINGDWNISLWDDPISFINHFYLF